jgi:hypothetical protein
MQSWVGVQVFHPLWCWFGLWFSESSGLPSVVMWVDRGSGSMQWFEQGLQWWRWLSPSGDVVSDERLSPDLPRGRGKSIGWRSRTWWWSLQTEHWTLAVTTPLLYWLSIRATRIVLAKKAYPYKRNWEQSKNEEDAFWIVDEWLSS